MFYDFSAEYCDNFLREENKKWIAMSTTEKEIYNLYNSYLAGKLTRGKYEEAVSCVLFWAGYENKITSEEYALLEKKYL